MGNQVKKFDRAKTGVNKQINIPKQINKNNIELKRRFNLPLGAGICHVDPYINRNASGLSLGIGTWVFNNGNRTNGKILPYRLHPPGISLVKPSSLHSSAL